MQDESYEMFHIRFPAWIIKPVLAMSIVFWIIGAIEFTAMVLRWLF